MGSWHVERLTSLHPDGVATDVQVRFQEPDGEVSVVMPARSARGLGEGLCEAADSIEPKDERRRFPWAVAFAGYFTAAGLARAFDGDWWMAGFDAVVVGVSLWIWRRREDR